MKRRELLAAAMLPLVKPHEAGASQAAVCDIKATPAGDINLIGNSFPALAHIASAVESCARPGLKVAFKLTPLARNETEQTFGSSGRCPFDAAMVSMGVFSNLYSRRQLWPLTALVDKFGARWKLEERMLVRVQGEVMAIAFMQNTQNLYFRQDLFDRHGLAVPSTYPEMLAVATQLKAREPSLQFAVAQGFGKGFDIATEFTNIFASCGGRFFKPGTALPLFNGAAGLEAVATMKALLPHMTPNALASNSDDVMNQLQQGKAAMGVLWASRASRMDDPLASKVVGKMAFAAAPSVRPAGISAAHLWWDGAVMPKNGDPAKREAAFELLMQGLCEDTVRAGNDLAIWVRSAYRPGRFGTGVAVAQRAGAPIWPGEPFFSLAHGEIGKLLPDALVGGSSAQAVLDFAAAAYTRAATEKGFIRSSA